MNNKPKITLTSLDVERLEALLDSLPENAFPGKAALQEELDRADVVEPGKVPPTIVTMNSTVRFSIPDTKKEFRLTLVYPKDVDGKSDKISVLAPVGSALLGLSVGDELEWPRPGGGVTRVRVDEIIYQPEHAGELHR
ncbi:MAG TPA: nucleoside diphosphate kinase regulator [Gammaproteobacteria bacterium]|nr:nucleoside diphosphate kinase regulator [Gammaproteobacteria bacterium]HET7587975.1 nucleoside diphosphate kinase regulator [Gammaproteobacteria bacterium]